MGDRFGAVRGGLPPYDVVRGVAARRRLLGSRDAWTIAARGRADKTQIRTHWTRRLTARKIAVEQREKQTVPDTLALMAAVVRPD